MALFFSSVFDRATIIDIIKIMEPSSFKDTINELNTAPSDPAIL